MTDIAEEPSPDDSRAAAQATAVPAEPSRRGPAWGVFIGLALLVFVVDQLAKSWIVAHVAPGQVVEVVGDYVRLTFSQNNGALFGLFSSSAILFALGSLVVLVLIVWYHARARPRPGSGPSRRLRQPLLRTGRPSDRSASRSSSRIARLIAESPMLNVKKRRLPMPISTKSTT